MAKASGPALFDLLDQEQVRAPSGMEARRAVSDAVGGKRVPRASMPQGGDRPTVVDRERPVVLGAAERRPESGAGATKRDGRSEQAPRLIEVDEDRVRVTLTSARAAVVMFVLLIGLLAAFELGRSRGQRGGFAQGFEAGRGSYASETLSDIEAARSAPPATEIIGSLLVGPGSAGEPLGRTSAGVDGRERASSGPVAWITGHTYIVAQGFQRGREADALRAKEFLASRGVETELIRYDSGAMQLITTRGFNRSDPAQRSLADQWLDKVHSAGEAYFASGGGYRLDGYFATFTGDRW